MNSCFNRAITVHVPEDVWARIVAMTPPQFRPQDTIAIAAAAFVEDGSSSDQQEIDRCSLVTATA